MWQLVGIELRKYFSVLLNTPKLSICGLWAVFWLSWSLENLFFLELRLLTKLKECSSWLDDLPMKILSRSTPNLAIISLIALMLRKKSTSELTFSRPEKMPLICYKNCLSLTPSNGSQSNKHWNIPTCRTFAVLKKKSSLKNLLRSTWTTTKSSPSKSTEMLFTMRSPKKRRSKCKKSSKKKTLRFTISTRIQGCHSLMLIRILNFTKILPQ